MSGSPRHGGKKTFLGSYGSVFQIINIYKVILKDYVLFFLSATVGHFSRKLLRWYFSFDGILANFWFIFLVLLTLTFSRAYFSLPMSELIS